MKTNRGEMEGAAREFRKWAKGRVNGVLKALPGLVRRRNDEAVLYLS